MTEQSLNVSLNLDSENKVLNQKKKNVRKAGKTLLVKANESVEVDEKWFSELPGFVSVTKTSKTGSYFLTFDNVQSSLDALKSLRKDHESDVKVKFAHYRVFFTLNNLNDETDYNKVKQTHIEFIENNTDSKVLYYKLYRNKGYLGCGDLTIDTKLALDKLLDKEQIKEFKLEEGYDGVFYRFNRKGPENSKNEFEENLE